MMMCLGNVHVCLIQEVDEVHWCAQVMPASCILEIRVSILCMCVRVLCVHVYMCMCTCVCVCMYVYVCTCMYMYVYVAYTDAVHDRQLTSSLRRCASRKKHLLAALLHGNS